MYACAASIIDDVCKDPFYFCSEAGYGHWVEPLPFDECELIVIEHIVKDEPSSG